MADPKDRTAPNEKPPAERLVKVGDTVHVVHHKYAPGDRFGLAHSEAKVEKVHGKGQIVDLIAAHDDPAKVIDIARSPRDDTAMQPDSWHFPEPVTGN